MGEFGVTPLWEYARLHCRIRNKYVKQFIGEFIGTAILCHYMVAGAIQHQFSPGASSLETVFGGIFGIMTSVLITGGLSGAHINPAVSFGLAVAGKLSWPSFVVYFVAQFLGGYLGSGTAVSLYYWIPSRVGMDFSDVINPTVFRPESAVPFGTGFYDQIVCSIFLMLAVCGLLDKRNMAVPKHMLGFFFCLVVGGVSLTMGFNFGAYMNPARDLCPRLMAITMGFKVKDIFTPEDKQQWTAGFFAPFIGSLLGTLMYIILVGAHLDDTEEDLKNQDSNNNGDWRSTQFIPKAQAAQNKQSIYNNNASSGPPSTYGTLPPPQHQQQQHQQQQAFSNPNATYGVRDDMRYRGGY